MARWFYTLFYYLITPLVLLRLAYRARKAAAYGSRIAERFGFFPAPDRQGAIWVHAVSVGETVAAAPVIKTLQRQQPHIPLVVTTMTPTGSERVHALFGDSVFHVYAPYDLPDAIARFMGRVQPRLLVIMETELWPNTIHACARRQIPVVLANARLSAKSAAGYQRFKSLVQPMLKQLSTVVAQSQADGERFVSLGLPTTQLLVSGSIKFDISVDDKLRESATALKSLWSEQGQRRIIIAASTHEGEDQLILDAFQTLRSNTGQSNPELANTEQQPLLILVPRHPERFERVATLSRQLGFVTSQRSLTKNPVDGCQVFIGDTMGELLLLFGCADIAVVGGSLVNNGGHNMLEAAAWGLPIVTGDSDFNFADISQKLQQQGAMRKVSDGQALGQCLSELLASEQLREQMGSRALQVMNENRGALGKLVAQIEKYL